MSTMHSDEQVLAINVIDKNVVVSASAGAGKTTVLIERLMKRIQKDKFSIDEIIAMTFTDAAAEEMKRRLSVKLNAAYFNSTDEDERNFLYDQITKLPGSHISTIHSFCLNVIRNYSFVLNLDPQRAQNILDEGTISLYQKEAMKNVMDRAYVSSPTGLLELLDHFSSRPENDSDLKNAISAVSTSMLSKSDPEKWLSNSISAYDVNGSLSNLDPAIKAFFFKRFKNSAEDLLVSLSEMEAAFTPGGKNDDAIIDKITATRLHLNAILLEIDGMDYEWMRGRFISLGACIPKTNYKDKAFNKLRSKFVGEYRKTIGLLFPEETLVSDMKILHSRLLCFGELTLAYEKEYAKVKEERNVIDYDDMERFTLGILRDKNFNVAKAYKDKYKEILVDEFQDSNDVQNEIVDLISKGDNVFRVGDIKQSIYRFRNAKPQLMQGLIDNQDPVKDEIIYLRNNYRSKETIVDFNNFIFGNLMNIDGLRKSYSANDIVTIGSQDQKGGSEIEFHWVDGELDTMEITEGENNESETDEIAEVEPVDDDLIDEEGNVIAETSVEEINEKAETSLSKARHIAADILARKNEDDKSCWRDYVVLVRSHIYKTYLKEAFDEVNIPSFIDVKSGFFQANSVRDMLLVMEHCLSPREEIHLIGVLLSPFFKFNQDNIALIHLSKQNNKSFYDAFKDLHGDAERKLAEVRDLSSTLRLREFVPYLMNMNRYYEISCNHQQRTNLDLFLEKAMLFDAKNGSLAQFVDFVKEVKDERNSEAIPISDDMDVVRVVTIHQSKGLQFPVVYFWSNKETKHRDTQATLMKDAELGIGLESILFPERFIRQNPIRIAIETKAIQEGIEENMRILYVALTRPQRKLIIVDVHDPREIRPLSRSLVSSSLGYSGWLRSIIGNSPNPLFTQKIVNGNISPMRGPSKSTISARFSPPQKDAKEYTVLTPSTQEKSFAPDFTLRYSDLFDGKERGTRLHRLIEKLPAQNWTSELILSIDSACTNAEIHSLLSFYASPFYQAAQHVTIEKEFPFAILDGTTVITGVIDMLAVFPDRIEMVDFKTDRSGNADDLRLRYEGQIALYRKSISLAFPDKEIKTFIYSFALEEIIEVIPK
jgi:ATP-dependent helicase/nuclease subunit A